VIHTLYKHLNLIYIHRYFKLYVISKHSKIWTNMLHCSFIASYMQTQCDCGQNVDLEHMVPQYWTTSCWLGSFAVQCLPLSGMGDMSSGHTELLSVVVVVDFSVVLVVVGLGSPVPTISMSAQFTKHSCFTAHPLHPFPVSGSIPQLFPV